MTRRGPKLSTVLRKTREQCGLSMGQLAESSGVDKGLISRLESDTTKTPQRSTLNKLASALGIEAGTLHEAAGFYTDSLPTLPIYLRTKYGQLPDEAQEDLQRYLNRLHRKYDLTGPAPGEDELPEPAPRTRTTRSTKGGKP